MIIQPGTIYSVSSNRVGIVWLLKGGVVQDGYDSSDWTYHSGGSQYGTPSYVSGEYINMPHNSDGMVNFNITPPRKYVYAKIQCVNYTTSNYNIRPILNGTEISTNRWVAKDGTYKGLTCPEAVTPILVRANGIATTSVSLRNYFGGWHITDIYFSDFTHDFII